MTHFSAFLLALALPLTGAAQSTPSYSDHDWRFFAGLGGSFGGYSLPNSSGVNVATLVPTVGMQLRPRLALQLSAAYQQAHSDNTYHYYAPTGYPDAFDYRTNWRNTLVAPALVRYALTRSPEHRFQADVLAGVSGVISTVRSEIVTMNNFGETISSRNETVRTTSACLTLGGGVRYALWPQVEVTAEAVLNRQVTSRTLGAYWANPNLSAGLRYRFGHSQ